MNDDRQGIELSLDKNVPTSPWCSESSRRGSIHLQKSDCATEIQGNLKQGLHLNFNCGKYN